MKYAVVVRKNHPGTTSWYETLHYVNGDTLTGAEILAKDLLEDNNVIQTEVVELKVHTRFKKTVTVEVLAE